MKSYLLLFIIGVLGVAQGRGQYSQVGGGTGASSGYNTVGGWNFGAMAQLPQVWVNALEWMGTTTNHFTYPATGGWTCSGTGGGTFGPYPALTTPPAPNNPSGLQAAVNDAETCRLRTGGGTEIDIPAGTFFSGNLDLQLPQTTGDSSSNFIVLQSTTPLPTGRTVCSHGIQDNLPESVQPGIRNYGCTGTALSYQLGTTVYDPCNNVYPCNFTLANGTPTSSSAYNDIASMYTIECTAANQNCVSTGLPDANNIGPHHYAIFNAEIRPIATQSSTLAPVSWGGTQSTLDNFASQFPTHIHMAYDYIHGDMSDAPISAGVATGSPMGHNSLPNILSLNACTYCSFSYLYTDKALRPSGEGHVWASVSAQQLKFVHNWMEGQSIGSMCGGYSATRWTQGNVSTSGGNTVTWVSGGQFANLTANGTINTGWNGTPININGVTYTVSTVSSLKAMTTTGSPALPTMTNVPYSWGPAGIIACQDVEDRANRYTYPYNWIQAFNSGYNNPNSVYPTTGGSPGNNGQAAIHLQAVQGGAINTVSVQAGGAGYALNDLLTLAPDYDPGAANGTVLVTGVGAGGAVSSVTVVSGTHYTVGGPYGVTGTGGATVNITSVSPIGGITGASIVNKGSGYAASNNLTVVESGASGGLLSVTTVTSGAIDGVVVAAGSGYALNSYVRKNAHETKVASRYVFDGNIVENVDGSGGQNGITNSAKANNSSGGTISSNYWVVQEHDTYTNNIYRNACNGPNWGFRSSLVGGDGGGVTFSPQNGVYSNNLLYNSGVLNIGCNIPSQGLNTSPQYGFRYGTPANNSWTVAPGAASFDASGTIVTLHLTEQPGGSQADTLLGDPVQLQCTNTTADAAFQTIKTSLGPPALAGTDLNLTIVYRALGTPPGTANQTNIGNCTYTPIQGYARYFSYDHNSDFLNPNANSTDPQNSFSLGSTQFYPMSRNAYFTNDIFVTGMFGSAYFTEGNATATRGYDATSLTLSYVIYPGRNPAVYTEYVGGVAQAGNPHLYFPTNPHCLGNDPTAESCIGVVALMGQSFLPANIAPADWHDLRLCHTTDVSTSTCSGHASVFAAGGPKQANDGYDMGANFAYIDTAQTANQYCVPTCSNGSYPDH